ncbi:MAG: carboxypeptidase-like regulatory domain-containing protein [Chitinophagaceae bacterium]|nr:carboxypeptidase-like regulatory domain-containing protein [Chitinophagaceae bacterium]
MPKRLLLLLTVFTSFHSFAGTVSGTVTEKNGPVLPFSSILIKGTTQGVSANGKGKYSIQLDPGEYTLVCQYIGHKSAEKKIRVSAGDQVLDFELEPQQYNLSEVLVKSGGEDPAYGIIRKAIATREQHLREIRSFRCEVYIKGQMQLRSYPKRLLGQKIDFQDGDTSQRKMIFLSETVARYSVLSPETQKVEVLSTKVSGRSGSFGLSDPQIISFYQNNISVGEELNPRGFVSPIANSALAFYRYKLEGSFYENGRLINRIKVIPRRKFEPLFSGHINIIEDEWRLESVDLVLLHEQQMQFLDTLRIQQLYVPSGDVWVIKNQVIYPAGQIFGFNFFGSFVQVYDKFDMHPRFERHFFDHTIIKFFDSSNKKPMAYWDSIRPLPLLAEEVRDYRKKDSLEQVRKDPHYLDSLDKKRNKITLTGLLFTGESFTVSKRKESISFSSLLSTLNYNTVEGGVISFAPNYFKRLDGRRSLSVRPEIRYGFANTHLSPSVSMNYNFGKKYIQSIVLAGGRRVFQFNNAEPISQRVNSIYTLLRESNYMKIYEADFLRLAYGAGIGNGLNINFSFQYQDRRPLNNLADMTRWKDLADKEFTPNYPVELVSAQMPRHQASLFSLGITWRPGADYIELPDRKIGLGSKYPTISAGITKGIDGLFGSDVDYTKWRVTVSDEIDLKLAGAFNYNFSVGGFLKAKKTYIPDYQHYNGNQTIFAAPSMSSFQLAPYYKYSNTGKFNLALHTEYHLNGLLTNKIPVLKTINWFFVLGGHALLMGRGQHYYETSFGIENIFKIFRVDFVQGFEADGGKPSGIRVVMPLVR